MNRTEPWRRVVIASVVALILLGLAWEMWLAPQRPGGTLLALKVLPLLAALPAFIKGRVKAYQWWSMLILVYLCEGVVRAMSDATELARGLGALEVLLSVVAFGAIVAYIRAVQAQSPSRSTSASH
jgi:uncharacterized membrane protein